MVGTTCHDSLIHSCHLLLTSCPRNSMNLHVQVSLNCHIDTALTHFKCSDVITKIKNTFHTAGINSFSMYRYLTQPVDGIPGHTQKTRYQSLSFNNLIRKNIIAPSKSAIFMDVNTVTNFSCYLGTFFTHSLDLDRLLTVEYQHLLPRSSAQRYHFPN